jgi:leucine dehydrogenase
LEIFNYAVQHQMTPQKAAMAIAENRIEQRRKENAK